MAVRSNGGVFYDQVLTGSLLHFRISGVDFSGAIDQNNRPVLGSAAEIVYSELSKRATIVIMNPMANDNNGMSFALETNRADWNDERIQLMLRELGADVGIDHLDFTNILVAQVPYDFSTNWLGANAFIELTDTPNTYAGSENKLVAVNGSASALIFVDVPAGAGDGDYIPTFNNQILSTGSRYIAQSAMTLRMPSYIGLTAGKTLTVAKSVSAQPVTILANPGELFGTDLGTDDVFIIDLSQDIVFIFDGAVWSVQLGALVLVQ